MRISDWSSDVCSSDLPASAWPRNANRDRATRSPRPRGPARSCSGRLENDMAAQQIGGLETDDDRGELRQSRIESERAAGADDRGRHRERSEEHTSELQSLMRISYAAFVLKKKKN